MDSKIYSIEQTPKHNQNTLEEEGQNGRTCSIRNQDILKLNGAVFLQGYTNM